MNPARIEEMHDCLQGLRERVPDLELVVLFGSTAKGRSRAGSDVDVAVRCAGPADLDVIHGVLAPAIHTDRLDLVDLRRASPSSRWKWRAPDACSTSPGGERFEFQSLAARRYCDTAKLRRAQRRAIHVFLGRYDLSL